MKKGYLFLMFACCLLTACSNNKKEEESTKLKDAFDGKFLIGVALNKAQFSGENEKAVELAKQHFTSIVAENDMKSMYVQPHEYDFFFDDADKFVTFGEENNMHIVGHTLIWHSQAPAWFFVDEEGNDVSREMLIARMKNHIHTVVGRYKGKIKAWDVVNEAIEDDGSFRKSKFYEIIGEDYIKMAFQFAHETDPEAELYYNDYSMDKEGKRQGVVELIKQLQNEGIKIDGIGMQGHVGIDYPEIEEFEKSIQAYAHLGVKVMITEFDLTALPSPWGGNAGANIADKAEYEQAMNPYTEGLPAEVQTAWEERVNDFFKLFLKHADKIDRVTLWGVGDADSWKNDWPIKGRTDYPLLFDRDYKAKPVVNTIIKETAP